MIFVSAPYSHPDKAVEDYRYKELNKYLAHLFQQGKTAVSPVAVGHPLVAFGLPGDYNFWKNYSLELLKNCQAMHVLRLVGWGESIGVQDEIEFAYFREIPVSYIDVN